MLIGISGKIGSGKDTVANYLSNYHKFKKISYGDIIKRAAFEYFRWDGKKDPRGRALLQVLGTVGRKYNTDIWVEQVKSQYNKNVNTVISDCRLLPEIEWIANEGGILIRLIRNCREKSTHITETELDDYPYFNFILKNNKTPQWLYDRLDEIVEGNKDGGK